LADLNDLDHLAKRVTDKTSFVTFLDGLRGDLVRELARPAEETAWGAGDWSYTDLEGFLEALGAWLKDGDRFDTLDAVAWRAFAEMLVAARMYE
jgi:hypothetical protein